MGAGLALRLANEPTVMLVLLYGTLRVQRAHARDQKVTEASPATSAGGGGFRSLARRQLRVQTRERKGGEGRGAHGELAGADDGAGEASERAGRRGGSPAAEEGENVGGGVPGLFWSRETTRRTREDRRSSRACRRGFGTAAAVRALVGGDGLRSVAGGRGSRGG